MNRELERVRDAKLVASGLRGDRAALTQLVDHYYVPIYRAAFRILHDADAASDVTQMTFLSAFENLDKYDPAYKFFSWIFRIGVNHALEQSRKRRLEEEKVQTELLRSGHDDPEEDVSNGEVGRIIDGMIKDMHENYRLVIVLRHYADLSYDEIADVLEIPTKTVRSRLYTARQMLRSRLQENGVEI